MNAKPISQPVLQLVDVAKIYHKGASNEVRALNGISLSIEAGDFTAIIGPSGSGKSTLMHILGALDAPTEGQVLINGTDISKTPLNKLHAIRAQQIGFVFQGFNLLPTLTALENVAEAALYAGKPKKQALAEATALLQQVDLGERLNNFPTELSGGQQQRVAIARALINHPSIILADEPTGELDTTNAQAIMDLLEEINQKSGQTVILVTHSEAVAARCRKTITIVDGKISKTTHRKELS